jgi:hypothetical protein
MVAHELICHYCYIHAFVGEQGREEGMGCEKDSPGLRKVVVMPKACLDLPQLSGI